MRGRKRRRNSEYLGRRMLRVRGGGPKRFMDLVKEDVKCERRVGLAGLMEVADWLWRPLKGTAQRRRLKSVFSSKNCSLYNLL